MRSARGRTAASSSGAPAISSGVESSDHFSGSAKRKGSGAWVFLAVAGCGLIYISTLAGGIGSEPAPRETVTSYTHGGAPAGGGITFSVDDVVANMAAPRELSTVQTQSTHNYAVEAPPIQAVAAARPLTPSPELLQRANEAAQGAVRKVKLGERNAKHAEPALRAPVWAPDKSDHSTPSEPRASHLASSMLNGVEIVKVEIKSGSKLFLNDVPAKPPKPMVPANWVPPPSQANYGAHNPRNLPKPALKDQSDGFLKARKAVWEVGRPVLTAPMPDKYKPELTAPKRPLKTRKPYSLPEPLWNTPHTPSNDAILALAVNYRVIDYVRFVGTLRRTGYSGDIVLAVSSKMDNDSRNFLMAMDVIAYPVAFNCSNGKTGKAESVKQSLECDWHLEQDVALPLAIIRHELYLSWAWQYDKSSRLLILDFRDTFFQRDPFESLTLGHPGEPFQQLLVLEHWPYKRMSNCPWNSGWVRSCWGSAFTPMKNHPVLCSGSYFATRDGMIDMETELLNEVRLVSCFYFVEVVEYVFECDCMTCNFAAGPRCQVPQEGGAFRPRIRKLPLLGGAPPFCNVRDPRRRHCKHCWSTHGEKPRRQHWATRQLVWDHRRPGLRDGQ